MRLFRRRRCNVPRIARLVIVVGSLVVGSFAAAKSAPAVVLWHTDRIMVKAVPDGEQLTVELVGRIAPGWHIYALNEPEGGPAATSIGLRGDDQITLLSVKQGQPEVVFDSPFQQRVTLFRGAASFVLSLQSDLAAQRQPLHILVRYQACSNRVCSPPRTDLVTVVLPVQ